MTECPPMAPARLIQPRASSSVTRAKQAALTSAPPCSAGTSRPKKPSSFISSMNASRVLVDRLELPHAGRDPFVDEPRDQADHLLLVGGQGCS